MHQNSKLKTTKTQKSTETQSVAPQIQPQKC